MTLPDNPRDHPTWPDLLRWARRINPSITEEQLAAVLRGLKAAKTQRKRRGDRPGIVT